MMGNPTTMTTTITAITVTVCYFCRMYIAYMKMSCMNLRHIGYKIEINTLIFTYFKSMWPNRQSKSIRMPFDIAFILYFFSQHFCSQSLSVCALKWSLCQKHLSNQNGNYSHTKSQISTENLSVIVYHWSFVHSFIIVRFI